MANPHDTTNYLVGGSSIFIKLDGETNYLDLGNVVSMSVGRETQNLDHFTSRSGKRIRDRREVISDTLSINFTLDELLAREVLELVFNADTGADFTQSIQTDIAQTVTAELGKFIDLTYRKISIDSVLDGSTALTEGTDYEVDLDLGMIKFLEGGAVVDASSIDVQYDAVAITDGSTLNPLTHEGAKQLDGCIVKVKGIDGKITEHSFTEGTIEVSGDMSINDQDWSTAGFLITVLDDGTSDGVGGVYRVY